MAATPPYLYITAKSFPLRYISSMFPQSGTSTLSALCVLGMDQNDFDLTLNCVRGYVYPI